MVGGATLEAKRNLFPSLFVGGGGRMRIESDPLLVDVKGESFNCKREVPYVLFCVGWEGGRFRGKGTPPPHYLKLLNAM